MNIWNSPKIDQRNGNIERLTTTHIIDVSWKQTYTTEEISRQGNFIKLAGNS